MGKLEKQVRLAHAFYGLDLNLAVLLKHGIFYYDEQRQLAAQKLPDDVVRRVELAFKHIRPLSKKFITNDTFPHFAGGLYRNWQLKDFFINPFINGRSAV